MHSVIFHRAYQYFTSTLKDLVCSELIEQKIALHTIFFTLYIIFFL